MKKFIFIGIAVLLVSGLGLGVFAFVRANDGVSPVYVYHFNPLSFQLEAERRRAPDGSPAEMVQAVIDMLYEPPRNSALRRTIPEALLTLDTPEPWLLNNRVLEVFFPQAYHDTPPVEETLFRTALVQTMTGLPYIDGVRVWVAGEELVNIIGEPLGIEGRESVLVNHPLFPNLIVPRDVVLYFVTEDLDGLTAELRTIDVNPNLPLERFIIEHLIEGPTQSGLVSAIPAGTRIRDVAQEGGIASINFSSDFDTRFAGLPHVAELTLRSIVHSVIANSDVHSVRFLINSERQEQFNGVPYFDALFEWDERFVAPVPGLDEYLGL